MESVKQKRFSFASFGRSFSFNSYKSTKNKNSTENTSIPKQHHQEEDNKVNQNRRAQKSKSLYIKSFNSKDSVGNINSKPTFDPSEAIQTNGKDIRQSIQHSLAAVLYASPHHTTAATEGKNKGHSHNNTLVPILVTPEFSESVGGILTVDDTRQSKKEEEMEKKKLPVEYDNRLEVVTAMNAADKDDQHSVTILWQGYGYTLNDTKGRLLLAEQQTSHDTTPLVHEQLMRRFEKDIWESYRGLIHPIYLFHQENLPIQLTVAELRRYYDNYGSMMLKIRESRMLKQQRHYLSCDSLKKEEWIIR
ncbi:MAG: hypothetical protein EXX96DRAFT_64333 [Benjaminiella poitrasii]|nr:MAG: hypothetical protein EXX96DRAFT_64333 [Benjaminiella poitrasii]